MDPDSERERPGDEPLGVDDVRDRPLDSSTAEPPVFGEPRHSAISIMGAHESVGDFARGLGRRRMTALVFAFGAVVMLMALLVALQ